MTKTLIPSLAGEAELVPAVNSWVPRGSVRPAMALERRADGLRVKLTDLGVDSGVVFAWGAWGTPAAVQGTLDRLFDVLSWRVPGPPQAS